MADPSYLSYTMADKSINCFFFLDSIYHMIVFSSYLFGSVSPTTQNEAKIIENQGFLLLHIDSDIISAKSAILLHFRLKMPI